MRGKSAISSWQLAVLLFLSRVVQFFLAVPQKEQPGALTAALLLPVSAAAGAALLLPAYFLLRRHPGKGLLDIAGENWGGAGMLFPAVFFLFSMCVLIQTACGFSYFLTNAAYPQTSPWLFILLLLAVGGYTASMGYEATARFASFVLAGLAAALLFVGISLCPQAQWEFLRPPSCDGWQSQVSLFLSLTLGNVETAALLFLIPMVNRDKVSVFWKWQILSVTVLSAIFLVTAAALGDYAKSQRFPFYAVTKIAEMSIFQRLDSLHTALWVFMALVRLALFLEVAGKSLARVLPQKASKYAVTACAALTVAASGILMEKPDALEWIGNFFAGGIPVLLTVFLLPLLLLASCRKRGRGQ